MNRIRNFLSTEAIALAKQRLTNAHYAFTRATAVVGTVAGAEIGFREGVEGSKLWDRTPEKIIGTSGAVLLGGFIGYGGGLIYGFASPITVPVTAYYTYKHFTSSVDMSQRS